MIEATHTHNWQTDPFSAGAYSYVKVGGIRARGQLAKPIGQTLFFAGEATDTTGKASTVAGAIASGRTRVAAIARRQLIAISGTQRPGSPLLRLVTHHPDWPDCRRRQKFSERHYGRFERRIPVEDVDEDKVSALFKNGVLTVTLPEITQRSRR